MPALSSWAMTIRRRTMRRNRAFRLGNTWSHDVSKTKHQDGFREVASGVRRRVSEALRRGGRPGEPDERLEKVRRRRRALTAYLAELMRDVTAHAESDRRVRLARVLHELDALIVEETNILLEDHWVNLSNADPVADP